MTSQRCYCWLCRRWWSCRITTKSPLRRILRSHWRRSSPTRRRRPLTFSTSSWSTRPNSAAPPNRYGTGSRAALQLISQSTLIINIIDQDSPPDVRCSLSVFDGWCRPQALLHPYFFSPPLPAHHSELPIPQRGGRPPRQRLQAPPAEFSLDLPLHRSVVDPVLLRGHASCL